MAGAIAHSLLSRVAFDFILTVNLKIAIALVLSKLMVQQCQYGYFDRDGIVNYRERSQLRQTSSFVTAMIEK